MKHVFLLTFLRSDSVSSNGPINLSTVDINVIRAKKLYGSPALIPEKGGDEAKKWRFIKALQKIKLLSLW
jgi:hypothetical protein